VFAREDAVFVDEDAVSFVEDAKLVVSLKREDHVFLNASLTLSLFESDSRETRGSHGFQTRASFTSNAKVALDADCKTPRGGVNRCNC